MLRFAGTLLYARSPSATLATLPRTVRASSWLAQLAAQLGTALRTPCNLLAAAVGGTASVVASDMDMHLHRRRSFWTVSTAAVTVLNVAL